MQPSEIPSSGVMIPYGLRRVPADRFAALGPRPTAPRPGDVALARLEKVGKNTRLELANGRTATLHEGDLLAVVFGNRYATEQFEGYARIEGDGCDLLSMGGMCGLVASRHASIGEPSKLRLLGAVIDSGGRPVRLRDYSLPPVALRSRPVVTVVCGTAMDAGKTHTAMSLIMAMARREERVAGIKLTGTAAGRDTWTLLDAGARPALDFIDAGHPSTYLCGLEELLAIYRLLLGHACAAGAENVVVEIADGLLQAETSALLRNSEFVESVDHLVFATGDPLAAAGGVRLLREWDLEPAAISGLISMSPLGMREAQEATGVRCLTAAEIQQGALLEMDPCAGLRPVVRSLGTPSCNGVEHELRQSS